MSDEVKPEVIKKTQDLLGKYFKKPPLTEKLLKKPPFRFIQDIVSAIIKETGFLEGLFTNEELSANITKEKEAKLVFLTKLIEVVKLITGFNLTVRATKIISGQEPTKTNELLQSIGKALDKKISSKEAVLHYKNRNEKHSVVKKSLRKEQPVKQSISGTSAQSVKNVKNDVKKSEIEKKKFKKSKSQEPETKEDTDEKRVIKSKDKLESSHQENSEAVEKHFKQTPLENTFEVAISCSPSVKVQESQDFLDAVSSAVTKAPVVRQKSVVSKNSNQANVIEKHLSFTKIINQDSTKRAQFNEHPEKVKHTDPGIDTELQKQSCEHKITQNSMSHDSTLSIDAESSLINVFNIIVEHPKKLEEMENDMVVLETNKENLFELHQDSDNNVTEDHGYLVAQILKTEQQLVNTNNTDEINKKVEIIWQTGILKDREFAVKSVGNLRNLIQTLIKHTNPLGKVLDYLQGDMEIMQKELMDYRKQYAAVNNLLEEERTLTEKFVNYMEESLNDIKMNVLNEQNKIHQVKINVSKNEHQIQRLLNDSA